MEIEDKTKNDLAHHLRVVEKALLMIDQLAHGPNSCDHKLVHQYAINALTHMQVARRSW
jgi:hypothetical protein